MSKTSKTTKEEHVTSLTTLDAPGTVVWVAGPPTEFSQDELEADAGLGSQNVTSDNLATPIISVLQSNSPQCKRSDGKFIPGALEGMIYNSVTREVYDGEKGLLVVPALFETVYIEWKPERGGLVAVHPASTPLVAQVVMVVNSEGKEVPTLPNGNTLIETAQHYVLVVDELTQDYYPAVVSLTSSNLRTSRVWNSLIKQVMEPRANGTLFNPASFRCQYRLTAKARTKDKYSWYTFEVAPAGKTSVNFYRAAKAFQAAVGSGEVKVKVEEAEGYQASTRVDDAVPF